MQQKYKKQRKRRKKPNSRPKKKRHDRKKQKEAGEYEEVDALKTIKSEVTKLGSELIKKGCTKENVRSIVAKFNDGEGDLASITSVEVCEKIIAAFEAAKKDKKEKKEGK